MFFKDVSRKKIIVASLVFIFGVFFPIFMMIMENYGWHVEPKTFSFSLCILICMSGFGAVELLDKVVDCSLLMPWEHLTVFILGQVLFYGFVSISILKLRKADKNEGLIQRFKRYVPGLLMLSMVIAVLMGFYWGGKVVCNAIDQRVMQYRQTKDIRRIYYAVRYYIEDRKSFPTDIHALVNNKDISPYLHYELRENEKPCPYRLYFPHSNYLITPPANKDIEKTYPFIALAPGVKQLIPESEIQKYNESIHYNLTADNELFKENSIKLDSVDE